MEVFGNPTRAALRRGAGKGLLEGLPTFLFQEFAVKGGGREMECLLAGKVEFRGLFSFWEIGDYSRFYADLNNPVGRKNMLMPQREERVGQRTPPGGQEGMAFVPVEDFALGGSIYSHL